ncbi:conserved hypothetical protein [Bacteroidetes oral taxon 274 str. F0058]|nr:conserved hypothetical protein [Bacteroidetes oral taxon 274 str. F0058]
MNRIIYSRRIQSIVLPKSYKEILQSFELVCLYEYEGEELDIWNSNILFSMINRDYYQYELLEYFSVPNVGRTFAFGSSHDDGRLYFDLTDFSVWEYWLDDGSTHKIADSFDELLTKAKLLDKE